MVIGSCMFYGVCSMLCSQCCFDLTDEYGSDTSDDLGAGLCITKRCRSYRCSAVCTGVRYIRGRMGYLGRKGSGRCRGSSVISEVDWTDQRHWSVGPLHGGCHCHDVCSARPLHCRPGDILAPHHSLPQSCKLYTAITPQLEGDKGQLKQSREGGATALWVKPTTNIYTVWLSTDRGQTYPYHEGPADWQPLLECLPRQQSWL